MRSRSLGMVHSNQSSVAPDLSCVKVYLELLTFCANDVKAASNKEDVLQAQKVYGELSVLYL